MWGILPLRAQCFSWWSTHSRVAGTETACMKYILNKFCLNNLDNQRLSFRLRNCLCLQFWSIWMGLSFNDCLLWIFTLLCKALCGAFSKNNLLSTSLNQYWARNRLASKPSKILQLNSSLLKVKFRFIRAIIKRIAV